jgi:hypothetical protein
MADFVGSTASAGALVACHGVHHPPVPRAGQTARLGIQEGCIMTEAAASFAGNLTDDPEVRYTEGGIAGPCSGWPCRVPGSRSRRSSPWSCGATRPSTPASPSRRAAGSWSWVGSSSGAGPLRMAAPARWSRSWPRSWGQACAGRRRPRPGRRGARASSQLDQSGDDAVAARHKGLRRAPPLTTWRRRGPGSLREG